MWVGLDPAERSIVSAKSAGVSRFISAACSDLRSSCARRSRPALDRAEELVISIEGRSLSPRILELRGRLAAAVGDTAVSERALRGALISTTKSAPPVMPSDWGSRSNQPQATESSHDLRNTELPFPARPHRRLQGVAKAEATPHLASQLDVLGFWINSKDAPEVNGAPQDYLGTANVTWIIRWRDLAQRNEVLPRVLSSPAWQDIFSRVPEGPASYLRIEAKFADALM